MDESYTVTVVPADTVAGAILATMGVFFTVFSIAWFILNVIAGWKIFVKAGKPGWHSLIPFLSTWDTVDLSWNRTMAWVMTCLGLVITLGSRVVPLNREEMSAMTIIYCVVFVVFLVLCVMSEYKLAKAFGKGFGFFLGLLFLNPIFKLILGFGKAEYQGRQG